MNLKSMKDVDIRTIDKSSLSELRNIQIKKTAENQLDFNDLQRQTQNFYCYRIGDIVVSFEYQNNGKSINDLFSLMLQTSL
ncbi:MAG: DUF6870 family protein [Lachnospiraceae bacterium]